MNQLSEKREDLMNLKKKIADMKEDASDIMTEFKLFLKKNKTIKLQAITDDVFKVYDLNKKKANPCFVYLDSKQNIVSF